MELAQHQDQFADQDARLIAIARQDSEGASKTIAAVERKLALLLTAGQQNVAFPILADADGDVARAYDVANFNDTRQDRPSIFIIGSSGEIVWHYIGATVDDRPGVEQIFQNLP